jgi:hypothetical protein
VSLRPAVTDDSPALFPFRFPKSVTGRATADWLVSHARNAVFAPIDPDYHGHAGIDETVPGGNDIMADLKSARAYRVTFLPPGSL